MTTTNTKFIVQTASASMPQCCWGIYRRVAVLEVEEGVDRLSMISKRARGCVRGVKTWEKLNVGKTEKCAYRVALAEAEALAATLNGEDK